MNINFIAYSLAFETLFSLVPFFINICFVYLTMFQSQHFCFLNRRWPVIAACSSYITWVLDKVDLIISLWWIIAKKWEPPCELDIFCLNNSRIKGDELGSKIYLSLPGWPWMLSSLMHWFFCCLFFLLFVCLFLLLFVPVNSCGHYGTVSSPNHAFSWANLNKWQTSPSCTYFRS